MTWKFLQFDQNGCKSPILPIRKIQNSELTKTYTILARNAPCVTNQKQEHIIQSDEPIPSLKVTEHITNPSLIMPKGSMCITGPTYSATIVWLRPTVAGACIFVESHVCNFSATISHEQLIINTRFNKTKFTCNTETWHNQLHQMSSIQRTEHHSVNGFYKRRPNAKSQEVIHLGQPLNVNSNSLLVCTPKKNSCRKQLLGTYIGNTTCQINTSSIDVVILCQSQKVGAGEIS